MENNLSKLILGTLQKHHNFTTHLFTCLALCCSLLEAQNEEAGMGFRNAKQEVQKNNNKSNTMWISEQLSQQKSIILAKQTKNPQTTNKQKNKNPTKRNSPPIL